MNDQSFFEKNAPTWLADYWPLVVILGTTLLAALALCAAGFSFMHGFMGVFFIIFAMFKFFDLPAFAKAFAKYDLVAMRVPTYGYVYPFLELLLGLAYLARFAPRVVDAATLLLMAVSAAGVFLALRDKRDINCACLGTTLKLPLSVVSVTENVGMGVMAGWMVVMG